MIGFCVYFLLNKVKFIVFMMFLLVLFYCFIIIDADEGSFRYRAHLVKPPLLNAVDVKAEVLFGRDLAARILARYLLVDDSKLQSYVNLLGQGIVALVGRSDIDFHFAVIDADHYNAYATPGGYIFVTHGLVKACQNEAQLVGVLSHEISHVNRKYIVEKFNIRGYQSSVFNDIGILIGGATQTTRLGVLTLVDQVMDLFLTGLDRDEELRADRDAALFMSLLHYDPVCYVMLLDGLIRHSGAHSAARTHPNLLDRELFINEGIISTELFDDSCSQERFNQYVQL